MRVRVGGPVIAMHQLQRADLAADFGPGLQALRIAARGDLAAQTGCFALGAQTKHPHHVAGGAVDLQLGHKLLIRRTQI